MFFSLAELEHHPILFDVDYNPGEIAFPDELTQSGPLHAAGQAELLRNTLGEIRLRGRLKATLHASCDRCLEPAAIEIDDAFDLFYRPTPKDNPHGEIHLAEGEVELSFYDGDGVALRDALREQVLLNLPMQLFCSPDCRGLCPTCGANMNSAPCTCAASRKDPRWSALQSLK